MNAVVRVCELDTFLPPAPTLAECLASAPPWYLASLCTHSGAASPQETVASLTEPGHLEAVLAGLDPVEKTAFWLVGTFNAGRGVPVEQCWATLAEMTGQRHRRYQPILDSLRRKGLVFVGHHNYRSVYFIPRDLRRLAEEIFFRPVIAHAVLPEDAYRPLPHQPTALRDMQLFLVAAARGEVSITQHGDIYRRQQIRLARLLGWPTWGPADVQLPREDYLAARLSLLWEYALSRHLAERRSSTVTLTPAVEDWLDLSWAERWIDMVEATLRQSMSWYQNVFTALQVLLWAPPGKWLPMGQALPRPRYNPASPTASQSLNQWLHRLAYLGLLEQAEDGDPASLPLRLTPLGRACLEAIYGQREGMPPDLLPTDERSFIVAPNFEVVAPFSIHPRLLLEVGALADLVHADQALMFRISRNSIYRALKAGMDGEAILGVLRQGSPHPLPQNVEVTIREWVAAYGQVWLARFHLLRCADPEVAARLKASPRLQPFLAGELTPRDLILREGDLTFLPRILEKEGYLPRAEVELAPPLDGAFPATLPHPQGRHAAVSRRDTGLLRHETDPLPAIRIIPSDWLDLAGRR